MSQPNTDVLYEVLDDLSVASYYKGKGNRNIKLVDEVKTAKVKIEELYVLKSDIEAKFKIKEGIKYDVKASEKVIVITPTQSK